MKFTLTASILAADFGKLQEEIASIESSVDALQADVMDGHFVKNLSFGAPVLRCIATKLPVDVHLMVQNPADRLDEFLTIPAVTHITFHAEAVSATSDRRALIERIHASGRTAGIALNPDTPPSAIDDVIGTIDRVLCMTVHPGFSGQEFLPRVLPHLRTLRDRFPALYLQVDGGITPATAPACIAAGANDLVAASAIFGSRDRLSAIAALRQAMLG